MGAGIGLSGDWKLRQCVGRYGLLSLEVRLGRERGKRGGYSNKQGKAVQAQQHFSKFVSREEGTRVHVEVKDDTGEGCAWSRVPVGERG